MYSYNLLPQKISIFCLKYENDDTFEMRRKINNVQYTVTAVNESLKNSDFPTRLKLG
jgi:hypothetical protein